MQSMSEALRTALRCTGKAGLHGVMVFIMMMAVEFSISGTLETYQWYIPAALLVTAILIPLYKQKDIQPQEHSNQSNQSNH